MTIFKDLPREILGRVMQESVRRWTEKSGFHGTLWSEEHRERADELLSYSLVSRLFRASSQRELLRHVYVETFEQLARLLEVLKEGDVLRGEFVHSFTFKTEGESYASLERNKDIEELVSLCPNIRELDLCSSVDISCFENLKSLARLELNRCRLSSSAPESTPSTLVLPRLTYLILFYPAYDTLATACSFLSPLSMPAVNSLQLCTMDQISPIAIGALAPQITTLGLIGDSLVLLEQFTSVKALEIVQPSRADLSRLYHSRILPRFISTAIFEEFAYLDLIALSHCPFTSELKGITMSRQIDQVDGFEEVVEEFWKREITVHWDQTDGVDIPAWAIDMEEWYQLDEAERRKMRFIERRNARAINEVMGRLLNQLVELDIETSEFAPTLIDLLELRRLL